MRMRLVAAGILCLASASAHVHLLACGDKFLVVSRGTRFERAPAARQHAGILVYANPASRLSEAIGRLSVEATLRRAGYKPVSVATADEFDGALRRGGWDLVLVDLADAPAAAARAENQGAPVVLPVALGATRDALARARRQYAKVIDSPTRGQTFVAAIDDVLVLRHESQHQDATRKNR